MIKDDNINHGHNTVTEYTQSPVVSNNFRKHLDIDADISAG